MRRTFPNGEVVEQIHEVYYTDDGTVDGWTDDPVSPCYYPDIDDEQHSLKDDFERFMRAMTFPTLDYETGLEID